MNTSTQNTEHTPGPIPIDIRGACDKTGACNIPVENADGLAKSKADPAVCHAPQQIQSDGAKPIQTSDALKSIVGLSADSDGNLTTQTGANELSAETIRRLQGERGILGSSGLRAESSPQTNCAEYGKSQKDCVSTVENSSQNLVSTQKTRVASTISRRARKVDNMPQSTSSFPVDNAMLARATPGPWHVVKAPFPAPSLVKAGRDCVDGPVKIAECFSSASYSAHANAALIARAPALLADNQRLREQVAQLTEALRTMVEQAGCYMDDGEATSEEIEAMAKARKALSVVERGNK